MAGNDPFETWAAQNVAKVDERGFSDGEMAGYGQLGSPHGLPETPIPLPSVDVDNTPPKVELTRTGLRDAANYMYLAATNLRESLASARGGFSVENLHKIDEAVHLMDASIKAWRGHS